MRRVLKYFVLFCCFGISVVALAQTTGMFSKAATTELISVNNSGEQANRYNVQPAISANGRFVAFSSNAMNLVDGGDANSATADVFIHDRETRTVELVSVSSEGVQGNEYSVEPSIGGDGRFVVFSSRATNLVSAGEANDTRNIFVRDRIVGTTELISISSTGVPGNHYSGLPVITPDGRFVAFYSASTNLVSGEDANGLRNDIYVHDRAIGKTERVSVNSVGEQANDSSGVPSISADGRFVAFHSRATNLVPGGDANGSASDVFIRDRLSGTTELVNISNSGVQADNISYGTAMSPDGRFVTFYSRAGNLGSGVVEFRYRAYIRDRLSGVTEQVSVDDFGVPGDGFSIASSVGADGRYVTFYSTSSNLIPGGDANAAWFGDIYVRDRVKGKTEIVSVNDSGIQANRSTRIFVGRSMSNNGRFVTFSSPASNMIPGGDATYMMHDIFVRDRGAPVANAGPDRIVSCTDLGGTTVMLDGSASIDEDGDPLTYSWAGPFPEGGSSVSGVNPTVTLPLGASTIELSVNDGYVESVPDSVSVTVAAQIKGFQAPLSALVQEPTTPPPPAASFRAGRTLPLKLQMFCGTRALTDVDVAAPELVSLTLVGDAPLDLAVVDLDSGTANDNGTLFRFSADGNWIYNLGTQSLTVNAIYKVVIQTPDGLRYATYLALK